MTFNPDFLCVDARALFPKLLDGSLDTARRGRLKGHLLDCRACAIEFDKAVSEAADNGTILLEKPLPTPQIPASILEAAGVRDRFGGIIWAKLQALDAGGVLWAKQQMDAIEQVLKLALGKWAARKHWVPVKGVGSKSTKVSRDVELVDCNGDRKGVTVKLEVVAPPTISADGELNLVLRAIETSMHGGILHCGIELSDKYVVSFEAKLQQETQDLRWKAVINAKIGICDKKIVVPWEKIRLTLQVDDEEGE
ncbi:MAG TPA: zf-HC2 domain-containing protein [Blastocatellia bacterium]|jgi:hypothetical protein